jgi:large subunit ribosomal protein L3
LFSSGSAGIGEELSVKLLIGRKLGMTQVFDDLGTVTPVTVIEVGPCPVIQVKTVESDGYRAAQIGFAPQKASRVTKPLAGHFRKAGVDAVRVIRESPLDPDEEVKAGDVVTVDQVFSDGSIVDVIGISKGRGFAGTIRRHNFSRGPMSHGSKNIREPGSTGAHTYPGRVFKGKRMPGQMGAKRRTVKNLTVVRVDAEKHRLFIRGAVPGPDGGILSIRAAKTPPPARKK